MNILSLFDGMACGMLAMLEAGVKVDRYVAYEYDEKSANASKGRPYGFAALTASHNFPVIEQKGDVFQADFTEFEGFDWLVGGSPCTYWSIAQKNNRETEASGMGWELFSQYVRALREAKPAFFIYENNKSMSKAIRQSITQTFGFEPICINSALVSAQNRQRLYWVGKRNEDGTYSKVEIEQPEDRGILLRDVLESGYAWRYKQGCIDANYFKGGNFTSPQKQIGQRLAVAEPVRVPEYGNGEKSRPISASYSHKGSGEGSLAIDAFPDNPNKQVFDYVAEPICATTCEWDEDGKPIKAVSVADRKAYTVYEVKDGQITIKGKTYPIKLPDGFYIIRKLTVRECMRLQTVPEWYEFPVLDSQAYKMLGNGWTVAVISHLILSCLITPTQKVEDD